MSAMGAGGTAGQRELLNDLQSKLDSVNLELKGGLFDSGADSWQALNEMLLKAESEGRWHETRAAELQTKIEATERDRDIANEAAQFYLRKAADAQILRDVAERELAAETKLLNHEQESHDNHFRQLIEAKRDTERLDFWFKQIIDMWAVADANDKHFRNREEIDVARQTAEGETKT